MDAQIYINTSNVVKWLNNIADKQIPYAAMNALNNVAFKVKADESAAMSQYIDRPTPFTQNAYEVLKANRDRLVATVRAKQVQQEYLKYMVYGGSESPKKTAIVVSVNDKLNSYGNMPNKRVSTLLGQKSVFSGRAGGNGAGGIYRRIKDGRTKNSTKLQLLIGYRSGAKYRPQLPFYDIARKSVAANIDREMAFALSSALSTAR